MILSLHIETPDLDVEIVEIFFAIAHTASSTRKSILQQPRFKGYFLTAVVTIAARIIGITVVSSGFTVGWIATVAIRYRVVLATRVSCNLEIDDLDVEIVESFFHTPPSVLSRLSILQHPDFKGYCGASSRFSHEPRAGARRDRLWPHPSPPQRLGRFCALGGRPPLGPRRAAGASPDLLKL